jgi:hypothetical protein
MEYLYNKLKFKTEEHSGTMFLESKFLYRFNMLNSLGFMWLIVLD